MSEIKNRITLEDDFTSTILEIIESTRDFQNQIKNAKEQIERLNNAKIHVDNKEAIKNISETRKQIEGIKKNVAVMINAKDSATQSIKKIGYEAKNIVSRPFTAIFKAKDEISGVIRSITDKVFSLKTLAAGIVLGGAGKGLYDFTLGQGVNNENYLATLITVLNSREKGTEALAWSYQQALKTPFRADDVVKGVSSLAVSQLDYKKFFMPLGNLAAVKNKPLDQAIEFAATLASGDMGEAVMRGRDLGISKQMWEKAGMTFDNRGSMTNTPGEALNAVIEIIKANHWNNLMDNKANTAEGLMSNIADTGLSFGRALGGVDKSGQFVSGGPFEIFKKQLVTIQPLLDKLYTSKGFDKLTKDVSNLVAAGGNEFAGFLKTFEDPKKVAEYENQFNQFIKDAKAGWEVAKEFGKAVGTIGTALKPVFTTISAHPKLFADLFLGFASLKIGTSILKGTINTFKDAKQMVTDIKELKTAVGGFFSGGKDAGKGIGNTISNMFKNIKLNASSIKGSASSALNTFKGVFKGINVGNVFKDMFKGMPKIFSSLKGSFGGVFKGMLGELPSTLKAALGPARTVFGTLGNVIKNFSGGAVKAMRTFFSVIAANPVVAIIVGIIAAAILLYEAWTHNWGGIRDKTQTVIEFVKTKIESVKSVFSGVKTELTTFVDDCGKAWDRLKEFFKNPITATVKFIKEGNTTFENDPTKKNALGTSYFEGGWTWVGEHGPELMKLPSGTQIKDNFSAMKMMKDYAKTTRSDFKPLLSKEAPKLIFNNSSSSSKEKANIIIPKIADNIVIREESDIDKIVDKLVAKLDKVSYNMA